MINDPKKVIAAIGGEASVTAVDCEMRAEALEQYKARSLDRACMASPTVADLDKKISSRTFRRGVGTLFCVGASTPFAEKLPNETGFVQRLERMPEKPRLIDYFKLRFAPASHLLRSADLALKASMDEDIVFACLIHDLGQVLMKTDHGWWGAQLFGPYVSEKVSFAIRFHQALRFFPDASVKYEYPIDYNVIFGSDYEPPIYIKKAYQYCRQHKWYMAARLITVNDDYAFDPSHQVDLNKFEDIIGRNFKQPLDGLGYDNSAVAHMWRSIAMPDTPL